MTEVAEWLEQAGAWLEANATRRSETAALRWGEGDDRVGIFHNLTFDEEVALVDEARQWQRKKCDAGFGAITWPVEYGGAGLTKAHEQGFAAGLTIAEDTVGTVFVLTNDADVEGTAIAVTSWTQGAFGAVECTSAGECTYTPRAGFNGDDSFTYTITDAQGATATATVRVTVSAVDDPPVAGDDAATTDEDTAVDVRVVTNDRDPDGGSVRVISVTQPAHGEVTCDDTTCTYRPDANYAGPDEFTYTVVDETGSTATATVRITVVEVNDVPVAVNDSTTTTEDRAVTVNVRSNDTDADGDPLTVAVASQPANGTVTCSAAGSCVYRPARNFNGTDSFTYTLSDGRGGTTTATVTVTVSPVNDTPIARSNSGRVAEDQSITVNLVANDVDVDGDTLFIDSTTAPANGTILCDATSCTYTPNANFNGVDTFTYVVSDGKGGTSSATVTITVTPVNDAPVPAPDGASTSEDQPVTIEVLDNDSDVDGDTLTIVGNTQGAKGTVNCSNGVTCTYTPNANQTGTDTFTYTVSDGTTTRSATVTITIEPVNDPQAVVPDGAITDEDTPVFIEVLDNDSDVDNDDLTVESWTQGANGSVTCSENGRCLYSPNENFNGTDTFTYTVDDGAGNFATTTVTVTVNPVNDAPDANDDSASTGEDEAVGIDLLANDTDVDGDTLQFVSASQPDHGTVVCNDDGECTYRPDPNFNGTDSFTYIVSDGRGGTAQATVRITVTPVNDTPVAVPDSATIAEDTSVTIPVVANDTDPDGDELLIDSFTQPLNGTVTCSATACTYTPDQDFVGTDTFTYTITDPSGATSTTTVTCTPQGSCTYTPRAGFVGTDRFNYTITDGNGGVSTAAVRLTVSPATPPTTAPPTTAPPTTARPGVGAGGVNRGDGQLVRTGSDTDGLVELGLSLLGAGAILALAARRGRRSRRQPS